jgi:beta-lactam-binding protein with PASTA domain
MEAVVSFWVVPWRVVGILLVVGIFVIIGLWSSFGKIKKMIRKIRGKKP